MTNNKCKHKEWRINRELSSWDWEA
jgi:hypothetical protein